MWRAIEVTLSLLALLLAFAGEKFSIPLLLDSGIACLGLTSIIVGWDAIITRRIVIGRRRHFSRQLYTGIPAMMQGVQLNLFGFFLIVIAGMMYFNADVHAVGIAMGRHPGLP